MELAVLERYAAASGDHARIHLDDETARAAGFPGVIAHGLLVMAYLGRAVADGIPTECFAASHADSWRSRCWEID